MKLQVFMIKGNPKVDSNHTCLAVLAVISLDSALKKDAIYRAYWAYYSRHRNLFE